MSFILDALKKSENDRQRQSSPALFEVKVAAPRRNFPSWAIGLAVLLGINLIILLWFVLRPSAPAGSEAPAAAANVPAAAPSPASPPAGMVTVPATSTYIPAGGTTTVASQPAISDAGVVGPSSAPPLAVEPVLSGQEPSVPPDYDARDYRPAITPAQASSIAAARRDSIPSRDEAVAQGTQIPDLRLDLHVYDPEPDKSFVLVNMQKVKPGETFAQGVHVDQITPSGAILSYRGVRFLLHSE